MKSDDGSNSHAVSAADRERDAQNCVDVADSYKSVYRVNIFVFMGHRHSIIVSRGDVLGVSLSRFEK